MQAQSRHKSAPSGWAPPEAEVIFASDTLRAYMHDAGGKRLVAMFDNYRPGRAGFPKPRRVKFFKSHNYASLHIETAGNDWFLSPDLPRLRDMLEERTSRYRFRTAMGFSMGGFGALLFARALKLRQALLVSPQVSVVPANVPWDHRFRAEGEVLDPTLDDVETAPWASMTGVILFDPGRGFDRVHARRIADSYPGLVPVAVPFGGHPASAPIVQGGLFDRVQSAVAGGLLTPDQFKTLRRQTRFGSEEYARNFNDWLARRGAR